MMRKCSVREIENNYSVSHGIVAKLTSAAEFSDAEDLAKQYGGPIYKQGTRYSRLPTFHTVYDFLRFFCLDKIFSPDFPFHNVGRSVVHVSQPYRTVGKINVLTILLFVSMFTCLSCHNFSNPIIVAFPITTLRFISLSHLPSFSTSDPRNVKLDTTSISSPYLKAVPVGCCHNLCLLYVEI